MGRVYYAAHPFDIGVMHLAVTETGLCRLSLPLEGEERFFGWLRRYFAPEELVESPAAVAPIADLITDYLAGAVRELNVPLDLRGTEFQKLVWNTVRRIPYGQTMTYGGIAAAIGKPAAGRAVGAANGANPVPLVVPCHRVVGTDGGLTGFGGGLSLKQWLLELEGARGRQTVV